MDLASLDKWDDYTAAKKQMFLKTDTEHAPWTVVKSNDKKRARLQAMRHVLSRFEYKGKDHALVGTPIRRSSGGLRRSSATAKSSSPALHATRLSCSSVAPGTTLGQPIRSGVAPGTA